MKILILLKFPYYGNGSGNYTRRLAENLAELPDMEVAVAAPDNRPIEGAKIYTLKPSIKAIFEGHPEWKGAKKYAELSPEEFAKLYSTYLEQITKIVDDFKPDVIHVNHAFYLTWIASHIKSLQGVAYVVTLHGTDIFLTSTDRRYRFLTAQALDRSEQIIAVAPHAKKWFLKQYGRKFTRKMRVVPPGLQIEDLPESVDTTLLDKKYHTSDKKVILFVGRITREKGVIYLLKAANKIKGEILIVGEGPEKPLLEEYAKNNKLRNVHFLGYFGAKHIDELRTLYQRADVVVLPSIVDESLGLVILEAMAAQTPVVASNKGGIPLVVKDGKNGILIRARSAKAISEAVNSIISNPVLSKEMGRAARQAVVERFDWSKLVLQLEPLYKRAAAATGRLQRQINNKNYQYEKDELVREKLELKKKIELIEPISENDPAY